MVGCNSEEILKAVIEHQYYRIIWQATILPFRQEKIG